MAKVNVDENQMIAGQMQVQSIPTVFAFSNGQPVDGFQGAVSASEIKAFVERVVTANGGEVENGLDSAVASDLVNDTSPQLGGNLDMNGNDIVSTSNADIDIIPNGTGDVNLGADTVQIGDNNANATLTTQGTGDLILNTNNGTNAGNITLEDGANGHIQFTTNLIENLA